MRIFLAGGTGAIGQHLIPKLVTAGHEVTATTRTDAKFAQLRKLGADPVVMDGLDAESTGRAVAAAEPDVVIVQMTSITDMTSLRHFDRIFAVTNRLRTEGTEHLLAAAQASGVGRLVVQSFTGWPNERTGGPVKTETDPLDTHPPKEQRESLAAIRRLEELVTAAPIPSVLLRYGMFYGPGAGNETLEAIRNRKLPVPGDGGGMWSWTHLADAASATVAAVETGTGIYNIVDDHPVPIREMVPAMAEVLGAPKPMHVPVWLARLLAGEVAVSMLTEIRGSSNAKAKRELGWAPQFPSWREGLAAMATQSSA